MIPSQVGERSMEKFFPDLEEIEWIHTDENVQLEMDHLHIWRCDLQEPVDSGVLRSLLSKDEVARSERLMIPEKRISFLAGRAALRIILGLYVKTASQSIRFHYLHDGKPVISDENLASQVHFNLAHSGKWMVLAVSRKNKVGIDIEEIRPIKSTSWALETLFHEKDKKAILKMPQPLQDSTFLRAWTTLEATKKLHGVGLGNANHRDSYLDLIQDSGFSGKKFKICRKGPYWYVRFSPEKGYCGAAVVETMRKPQLRFYEFALSESSFR